METDESLAEPTMIEFKVIESELSFEEWCKEHVQGTAMWWMAKAMTRCYRKIKEWQAEGFSARMVLQVHDELVFDFPKGADIANLDRARELCSLMSIGGEDIGVPTPVAIEYHANDWSEGVRVK
jgi:DNA polymerase I-like protein with 3'-5' exonuclease and polymerase domains